jgi:divalent metal cation (Fe/Co/Zn/Cd) transporter
LSTHEVHLLQEDGSGLLELHVEVPSGQTLHAAHAQVSALEQELVQALPSVDRVVTHIEPRQSEVAVGSSKPPQEATRICTQAQAYLEATYPHVGWHHFATHAMPHGYALNLHAALPPQISLEAAHELAESAEASLRSAMPELARITIHTEPDEQAEPQF